MDSFFILIIELLIHQAWLPEQAKIDVRLLLCFPNNENKLDIEIENVTNNIVELESAVIVLKKEGCRKLCLQTLNFSKEQLILFPFSPQKMRFTFSEEEMNNKVIKYFEFKLLGKKTKMKVAPINQLHKKS